MTAREPLVPVLLEKVYQLIKDKVDPNHQQVVTKLGHHLFNHVSHDDLLSRNESDLYGAVVSLWQHLKEKSLDELSVRVFNPSLSRHGWQSTHTIVEIIVPDMAFVVDSLKMTLSRMGLSSHIMLHGPANLHLSKGQVVDINNNKLDGELQSVFHIEVDRLSSPKQMEQLQQEIISVMQDTHSVVSDWQPMTDALSNVVKQVKALNKVKGIDNKHIEESLEFLNWLGDHNFTLMGYKEYRLVNCDDELILEPTKEPGLGLFNEKQRVRTTKLSQFSDSAREEATKPYILILTKGNRPSRIHRPAYNDYIGIKTFDQEGNVIGEHRFTGLYTSAVYNQSVERIPLVRNKVARILQGSGFLQGSYAFKALHNILETYPRDELLQASEEELLHIGMGVVQMQDRDMIRLFVRKDPFGRFLSCMVYVTKERYNTELRRQTQRIFKRAFNTDKEVEFTTYFSESPLARTHYIVRVDDSTADYNIKSIEQDLMEASSTWGDRLKQAVVSNLGESRGLPLAKCYMDAFPRSYQEAVLPNAAVADIERLELLSELNPLGMLFYRPQEELIDSKVVHLKLYHKDSPIHLSDVMPMLENFDLRVIGESPYQVETLNGNTYWILDFSMLHKGKSAVDFNKARDRFQSAFAGVWQGELENDGFNRLILGANLTGVETTILRAYAKYMRQVGFPFSQHYIGDTLAAHPTLAKQLVSLFEKRFQPSNKGDEQSQQKIIDKINAQLDKVDSLDDDRIVRRYVEMIRATLRTNYYQTTQDGNRKPCLALKLSPKNIPEIPKPVPEFEMFVYAPDVEGVHLRGGKVARGGLRWSDRQEDFRTEVLGLVKAQQVKNTVILPVGAKGGFVCKKQHLMTGRDEIFAEGKRCYRQFISSLLDVADNIVDGQLVAPPNVIRHDEDDSYLVVAADKGTATFSDIANSVSEEYNFWLGDAFASGGSNGYDHKIMGITAKGGWESVKRHFREIDVDCQTTDFTVIGVGDMAGDVFGNGMLLSKQIRLQGAFNHLHIFIDPNPDSATSYKERERLFNTPRTGWDDYDTSLISKGGGVFSRKAKSVTLSPEIKSMLGIDVDALAPNDLIKQLLMMKVDLLWNGGIGTYVKSSKENHVDVGDRANDALRINGNQLQAKVVGEGGNLGLTQLGRIEFALNDGRVNTDFIDNVGGVDSSDNEVNIKILLNGLVQNSDLTVKQRNEILNSMEQDVSNIVLHHAYCQSESISVTEEQGVSAMKEQMRFIHMMEKAGHLDRQLEYIPDDEQLQEREKQGVGLSRPELSVLVAYGKMQLKEQLANDLIANDSYHSKLLEQYFPDRLRRHYLSSMDDHPLRSEIIATALANDIVNEMGCNFVTRLQEETGASVVDIANAFAASKELFKFSEVFSAIRSHDNRIQSSLQYQLLIVIRRTLRRLTRWLLRNRSHNSSVQDLVDRFKVDVDVIVEKLDSFLVPSEVRQHQVMADDWIAKGVDKKLANYLARLSSLYCCYDISLAAKECGTSIERTAKLYFYLGDRLSLHWFLDQINNQVVDNNWQALARAAFREDLDWQQRKLSTQVLTCDCGEQQLPIEQIIDSWIINNEVALQRWENTLNEFKVGNVHEFAKFSVALRELMLLNLNCEATK
ncbi:NAD-glutamate dehydrogenase [Vibrio sp. UCD-FRSSP16_10]|uniref:NAD-glutamate dehydrogenase n=1 Tax=unclassified Vibrio TaxID=2614977 RepID=UPI00080186CE|nr:MULTISPECIES: NAD-glutamate dehydrogenase [unclassified Vibrio]OBT12202.1 NAD-glutamate dehydrogenase [Vibrio sp. UCD-FRSSP16_30]OBT20534.1 NAD-glutamate dehydrogenase [Vibrio sp. UCD-FRSSP16_10]